MFKIFLVGLGGFLGAVARYLITGVLWRLSPLFPWGTLLVNTLGSLSLGLIMALVSETLLISPAARLFLAVGFLGSFTTFSTFVYETSALLEGGNFWLAGLNLAASIFLGLLGIRLGALLAYRFFL